MGSTTPPGDRLATHIADATKHPDPSAFVPVANVAAPAIIFPPASLISAGLAVWPVQYAGLFNRFQVTQKGTYRYLRLRVGVQSGNIQVGVARLVWAAGNQSPGFTRVMSSGIIACPAGSTDARIDCGATSLDPGDYAAFVWADNTTVTLMNGATSGFTAAMWGFTRTFDAAGVPTSGVTNLSTTTRWVCGLGVEQAYY